MAIYRVPEDGLEEAQTSIFHQRKERVEALAAGGRPFLDVSDAMPEPDFSRLSRYGPTR